MASVNKVILLGNITREPELRYTPSGVAVVDVGMAMNRRVPDNHGGYTEKVCFMEVSFWDKQAETVGKYLHKGDLFYCEGELEQTERVVHAGTERQRTEKKTKVRGSQFQLLPQRESRGAGPPRSESRGGKHDPAPVPGAPRQREDEDEIPF